MGQIIALEGFRGTASGLQQEADHRMANQLMLAVETINVQISRLRKGPGTLSREAACEILSEIAGKVVGIARLHRHLAERTDASAVDIGGLLIEIVREMRSSLGLGEKLRVSQKLSAGCHVDKEQAQTIALMVVEIVMNAVKYAHPTGIPIELNVACTHGEDGTIVLELGDDGIGLPEGFNVFRDGGFGFRLIRALADKIGAQLRIESDYLGLSFRIQIPSARRGEQCASGSEAL